MKAYAVFTGRARFDLDLQIVVHSQQAAKREARDLREMGMDDVRIKVFEDESSLFDWFDKNC